MERKKMAFAGSWYPSGPNECEASIKEFLGQGEGPLKGEFAGGIVPHAGWYFSGAIACRVIASLKTREKIDTVVLFGAHMHPYSAPFILGSGALETPFGDIETDQELTDRICDGITIRKWAPAKFPDENTLELQLPFIRYFFPEARIVVMGVPPSNFARMVGSLAVVEAKGLGRNIKIIGSTDMTHYGPDFGFTTAGVGEGAVAWVRDQNDRPAIEAMIGMKEDLIVSEGLQRHSMCCPGAAAAAAAAVKKMGAARAVKLGYATSYEKTAGSSFVGYAGILYALS